MKPKLSTFPDRIRPTEQTKKIVRKSAQAWGRSVQDQIRWFILLGIHYQKILDGEVSPKQKFNPEDYS